MNVCLSAKNVRKTYDKEHLVLDDLSLEIYQGEIRALLGPNGAGKTTLVKILAALLTKDSGQVEILGYDLDKYETEIRHLTGYVGQDSERSSYARLNVVENLHFFGSLRGLSKKFIDQQVEKLANYFNFEANLDKEVMKLSGGQRQTVVIMRALLHSPPLVYLDEPTKGLDPIVAKKMRSFLKNYVVQENKSLLMTTHILSEVENLADRVSLMNNGGIVITDTAEALKSNVGAAEFVEVLKEDVSADTKEEILQLPPILFDIPRDPNWISFGVTDLFNGTEAIIQTLRQNNIHTQLRTGNVSLEDAFLHYVNDLEDSFD